MGYGHRYYRIQDKSVKMNNSDAKCVIISAGDFVPVEIPVEDGDYVIACDAGFLHARDVGILPDLIVGDFDSLAEAGTIALRDLKEIEDNSPERIVRLDVKKDDTDTIKAVKIGLSKGYKKFYLYGALGGKRIDHTIANIQTLNFIKNHGAKGYIMEHDKMLLIAKDETVKFHRGNTGYISVFSLSEMAKGVTIKGLMYNLERGTLTNDFPLGVSNEFIIDEEAEITVEEGTLLITVYFSDEI